jgi:branched-chain amino acid transport system ATP-binding protein
MLEARELDAFYGGVQALRAVDLNVHEGEIVTLVGANGAGKSSLLRAISGVISARGLLAFEGRDLIGLSPERIARLGVAHVPEGRHVFPGLTVVENLEVAAYALGIPNKQVRADVERTLAMFPSLAERRRSYGWSLSGGEQQMLAIGRGLMVHPRLLLLDEPSLGLAPILVQEMFRVIEGIREEGHTILLVEQNAAMALSVADRGYVLETGAVVREGPARELLEDEAVVAAYLGGGHDEPATGGPGV